MTSSSLRPVCAPKDIGFLGHASTPDTRLCVIHPSYSRCRQFGPGGTHPPIPSNFVVSSFARVQQLSTTRNTAVD